MISTTPPLLTVFLCAILLYSLPQDKNMRIEFLGMKDGCPNTPKMWNSLQEALREFKSDISLDSLDVIELSEKKDLRAGYGSPTVLVNGKDLFGAPVPSTYEAACRIYRGGVPGSKEILGKLKALKW